MSDDPFLIINTKMIQFLNLDLKIKLTLFLIFFYVENDLDESFFHKM